MSGQKGRDVLIKIGDGGAPEAFVTVAGIRAKTISLNARTVDGTSGESPDAWRELVAGAGVKSASVSGAGVFKDAASDALIQQTFFTQAARTFQLIIPDFGILQGPFLIEALDYSGDHDGEAAFAITLASAGVINFSAVV
jgi:TP901-1 family phage major tail protein